MAFIKGCPPWLPDNPMWEDCVTIAKEKGVVLTLELGPAPGVPWNTLLRPPETGNDSVTNTSNTACKMS